MRTRWLRRRGTLTWWDRRRADLALLGWHLRFGARLVVAHARRRCVACDLPAPEHKLDCGWRD